MTDTHKKIYLLLKMVFITLLLLCFHLEVNAQSFTASLQRANGESTIDYIARRVTVTGTGASTRKQTSLAEKKLWALTEARKNCITTAAQAVGEISVENKTFLQAGELKGITTSVQIQNYVQGIKQIEEKTEIQKDGSVIARVMMIVEFDGDYGLNKLLFNTFYPPEKTNPRSSPSKETAAVKKNAVSGFVFDVCTLPVEPSMTPRIYSESGDLLYGPENVSYEYAVQYGIVGYTRTIEPVKDRVGSNPVLITVKNLKPNEPAHILLSESEVKRIKQIPNYRDIFTSCRVVFLIR